MLPASLLHEDGRPFTAEEVERAAIVLRSLSDEDRQKFAEQNTKDISSTSQSRLLVVSGPGTGKSYLFAQRISTWLGSDEEGEVLVTTFIRKLQADLQKRIVESEALSEDQKKAVRVMTFHGYALSILEAAIIRGQVLSGWSFRAHVIPFDGALATRIWRYACHILASTRPDTALPASTYQEYESNLCDCLSEPSSSVDEVVVQFRRICTAINGIPFVELPVVALEALDASPELAGQHYLVIDELQDLNRPELRMLDRLIELSRGALLAGDDDQVLYEFKGSSSSDIVGRAQSSTTAKAMLPLSRRCSSNIMRVAETQIVNQCERCGIARIPKLSIPMSSAADPGSVRVVACWDPTAAAQFLTREISITLQEELQLRSEAIAAQHESDPYLLVLSKDRGLESLGKEGSSHVRAAAAAYGSPDLHLGKTVSSAISCVCLGEHETDDMMFLECVDLARVSDADIADTIAVGLASGRPFTECNVDISGKLFSLGARLHDILYDSSLGPTDKANRIEGIVGVLPGDSTEQLASNLSHPTIVGLSSLPRSSWPCVLEGIRRRTDVDFGGTAACSVLTISQAKGLNADEVVIAGFDDVHMKNLSPQAFYVALTRARRQVTLLTILRQGGCHGAPTLLDDLPEECITFWSYTKGGGLLQLQGKAAFYGKIASWSWRPR
jgi:superfamily I DNA/RNA helicase